jgi:hypothetical protein
VLIPFLGSFQDRGLVPHGFTSNTSQVPHYFAACL